ncbi:MAG: ATP-grasp domain-containing protein [Candidatus Woesearchaeota archaeon]|nr:ATP-grasp domain-containing protein [Candidatus Woesearchaeota archaeon]
MKSDLLKVLSSFDLAGVSDEILFVCTREFYERRKPRFKNILIDSFDGSSAGNLKAWAIENKRSFSWVMALDDDEQFYTSSRFSEILGIPFFSGRTQKIASNKFLMKNQFRKNGVPTSNFKLVKSIGDLGGISFPNVLKVTTGAETNNVYLSKGLDELKENFLKLIPDKFSPVEVDGISIDPSNEFILEEYVGGEEFSCDFIITKNGIDIIRVTRKIQKKFGFFSGYHLMNRSTIAKHFDISGLMKICAGIARSFDVDDCICMMDFKVQDSRIFVIESSVRPGFSNFIPLMDELYGYSSWGIYARHKLGLKYDINIPEDEGMIVYLWAENSGKIECLDLSCIGCEGIIGHHLYNQVGDVISDEDYGKLLGYVMIKNPKDILGTIDKIYQSVKIVVA